MKKWHTLSKAYAEGNVSLPATAILAAQHNMVTETIPDLFMRISSGVRNRKFFCPADVVVGLKSGLFASDTQVQAFNLPTYDAVDGVPGLASSHESIDCAR